MRQVAAPGSDSSVGGAEVSSPLATGLYAKTGMFSSSQVAMTVSSEHDIGEGGMLRPDLSLSRPRTRAG
jgi:hypothetical protein